MHKSIFFILLAAMEIATFPAASFGQNEDVGWAITSEVTGIWAGGNSSARTFGLNGSATRTWERSAWKLEGGAIRTESSLTTRTAVGSSDDFEVVEVTTTATTAEAYSVRSRYDYSFSDKATALVGADWLRNTFSGIDSRFLMGIGLGNTWYEADRGKLSTSLGLTYTFESEVVMNPFTAGEFPGLRVGYDGALTVSSTTEFTSSLIADWNLDNTDDLRLDWTNAVQVSINSVLSIKPAFKMLWRNAPALDSVPLETIDGDSAGDNVLVPLEKTDTFVTLALVLSI